MSVCNTSVAASGQSRRKRSIIINTRPRLSSLNAAILSAMLLEKLAIAEWRGAPAATSRAGKVTVVAVTAPVVATRTTIDATASSRVTGIRVPTAPSGARESTAASTPVRDHSWNGLEIASFSVVAAGDSPMCASVDAAADAAVDAAVDAAASDLACSASTTPLVAAESIAVTRDIVSIPKSAACAVEGAGRAVVGACMTTADVASVAATGVVAVAARPAGAATASASPVALPAALITPVGGSTSAAATVGVSGAPVPGIGTATGMCKAAIGAAAVSADGAAGAASAVANAAMVRVISACAVAVVASCRSARVAAAKSRVSKTRIPPGDAGAPLDEERRTTGASGCSRRPLNSMCRGPTLVGAGGAAMAFAVKEQEVPCGGGGEPKQRLFRVCPYHGEG